MLCAGTIEVIFANDCTCTLDLGNEVGRAICTRLLAAEHQQGLVVSISVLREDTNRITRKLEDQENSLCEYILSSFVFHSYTRGRDPLVSSCTSRAFIYVQLNLRNKSANMFYRSRFDSDKMCFVLVCQTSKEDITLIGRLN